ncbi:DUF397 domain-containing protein [Streptomyces sp. NPDC101151]|uniref:DUF397 domain-containing protein n=1 Tax=Streptomyces sp. NPDC101151 TaxID=3366115 RepID=UPI003805ACFB
MERQIQDMPFRKSSYSPDANTCVEVGVHDGLIKVRDSKDQETGPRFALRARAWDAFVDAVKTTSFSAS